MKKILRRIIILIILLLTVSSCGKKDEQEEEKVMKKTEQDLKIIEENSDGEIVKGVLEGYLFTETEEESDRIKIQMENGDVILFVLSNQDTPITIANFKKLVSRKFYDGLIFHRVIKDFMIQGGDPTGTGYHGSDEYIKGEFLANGIKNSLSHTRGVVSMARSGRSYDSASSQFFICHKDVSRSLDGNYAAFGKVFAGMNAVDAIANIETDSSDRPEIEQKIKTIRFVTIEKA